MRNLIIVVLLISSCVAPQCKLVFSSQCLPFKVSCSDNKLFFSYFAKTNRHEYCITILQDTLFKTIISSGHKTGSFTYVLRSDKSVKINIVDIINKQQESFEINPVQIKK
jgi:hypothetical protein